MVFTETTIDNIMQPNQWTIFKEFFIKVVRRVIIKYYVKGSGEEIIKLTWLRLGSRGFIMIDIHVYKN